MSGKRKHAMSMMAVLSLGGMVHARSAHAQGASATGVGSDEEQSVSETLDALPGIYRIGVPAVPAPRLALATGAEYGYTEPQNDADTGHHRIGASLAAGFAPWSFLSTGLRIDFRHDIHGEDELGPDSGSVISVTPIIRGGAIVSEGLHLGAEVRAAFSGNHLSTGVAAPELDFRALAAYTKLPTWNFALQAGYRLGQGGAVIQEAANLRPGDRVALGVSEFDALLLGVGATKRISNSEILGEVTWDLLLGSNAPGVSESPLRLTAGLKQHLSDSLILQGTFEILPLGRAPSLADSPLVPIEPRFTIQAGLIYRFGKNKEAPPPPVEEEEVEEKAEEKVVPPPVVKKVVPGSIQIVVVEASGHPISDALITLEFEREGKKERMVVPLRDGNTYILDEVVPIQGTLSVEADLLTEHRQEFTIVEGENTEINIQLKSNESIGGQLRGLVRAFSGHGLKASIRVEPGSHEVTCDEDGEFKINLPPGDYEVIISSEGYSEQRRKLSVGKEGVTVLNADLQRSSK